MQLVHHRRRRARADPRHRVRYDRLLRRFDLDAAVERDRAHCEESSAMSAVMNATPRA